MASEIRQNLRVTCWGAALFSPVAAIALMGSSDGTWLALIAFFATAPFATLGVITGLEGEDGEPAYTARSIWMGWLASLMVLGIPVGSYAYAHATYKGGGFNFGVAFLLMSVPVLELAILLSVLMWGESDSDADG